MGLVLSEPSKGSSVVQSHARRDFAPVVTGRQPCLVDQTLPVSSVDVLVIVQCEYHSRIYSDSSHHTPGLQESTDKR
jgi:hypothetical protein